MAGNVFKVPVTLSQKAAYIKQLVNQIEQEFKGLETNQAYHRNVAIIQSNIDTEDNLGNIILRVILEDLKNKL